MNVGCQDSIIAEWLRSLGLQQYSTAFYDNGYDELELCKQIQDADLDAIGVTHPLHRKILLDSVLILKSEGATSVYFTLENVQRGKASGKSFQPVKSANATRELIYDVSPKHNALLHSSHLQHSSQSLDSKTGLGGMPSLIELVQRKLEMERVDIGLDPYIQSGELCVSVVTALAMRYAEEMSLNYFQVLSVMESLVRKNLDSHTFTHTKQTDARPAYPHDLQSAIGKERFEMFLGHVNPPAVPSCPPPQPSNTHQTQRNNVTNGMNKRIHHHQYQRSQSACSGLGQPSRMYTDRGPESAIMARSGPMHGGLEHTCGRPTPLPDNPPHMAHSCMGGHGGYPCCMPPSKAIPHNKLCKEDAHCKELALFEQKRLEALMQVKSGKLHVDEAMAKIRMYEKQRNACCEKKAKKKSTTAKIGEFFKLPSFRRKNKQPEKLSTPAKSTRSMSCTDTTYGVSMPVLGSSLSTTQLANEFSIRCTCGIQPTMPASRSMNLTPVCACDDCQKVRAGGYTVPPPQSPMLGHRSTAGGMRGSARYPSNRRVAVGADIVRAPPTCRQCNTPLNQPQKPLPKFYSPQVTRKTYQPLHSPTPHHYNKPFFDKFDAWYQQNLPSDDETRHLIDPNQSDDSSMNASFDAFGQTSRSSNHSFVSLSNDSADRTLTSQQGVFPVSKSLQTMVTGMNELSNSYHSDSLSSDDFGQGSTRHIRQKQGPTDVSPTAVRGRRDSGCYLSNENLNNNSSNSSTCEKKDPAATTTSASTTDTTEVEDSASEPAKAEPRAISTIPECSKVYDENTVLEKVRRQMIVEGIDLTAMPYTDQDGQWCVPISLVSRYAQVCNTDLTTVALAMDAARCSELRSRGQRFVALSADTKRNPEQKRISGVHDFLVLSGLPMYTDLLLSNGCDSLRSLATMNRQKLREAGVTNPLHIDIIVSAINSTWNTETALHNHLVDNVAPTTAVQLV